MAGFGARARRHPRPGSYGKHRILKRTPMDKHLIQTLAPTYQPMKDHLFNGIIPFWRQRAGDGEYGGYVTNFDESGKALDTPEKDGYSQARLVWFFSHVCRMVGDPGGCGDLARAGVEFMIERFWDK